MRIALCCDANTQAVEQILKERGEVDVFQNEKKGQSAGQKLSGYLSCGGHCDLAVVSLDSAAGIHNCRYIKEHQRNLPVLWISEDKGLWPESRRIGVEEFLVKPVPDGMLRKIINHMLEGVKYYADMSVR